MKHYHPYGTNEKPPFHEIGFGTIHAPPFFKKCQCIKNIHFLSELYHNLTIFLK
ncbi:hypothetical protein D922_00603 [Enterococcus faecalis 06-MB-DW-09]|nr:hypothetical protein D931_00268 [Enterococcus faecium 13.SD.W.09]EPH97444.1 hypothetical protein D922_00603 [Enterococcus faecalis 06-MB-DW-09]